MGIPVTALALGLVGFVGFVVLNETSERRLHDRTMRLRERWSDFGACLRVASAKFASVDAVLLASALLADLVAGPRFWFVPLTMSPLLFAGRVAFYHFWAEDSTEWRQGVRVVHGILLMWSGPLILAVAGIPQ